MRNDQPIGPCFPTLPIFRRRRSVVPPGLLFLVVSLSLVLVGTGCRTNSRRLVSDPSPAIARLQAGGSVGAEVTNLVTPLVEKRDVLGMVVGVITPDGATQVFSFGDTGRSDLPGPPRPDSMFQIGSISKVLVAALLAKLVDEGVLHYEDTVRSILPASIPMSKEVASLTLYDLATHTGGLGREPMTLTQLGVFLRYLVTGQNLYSHLTAPYVYHYLRHCHPKRQEPRQFVYSNIGIGLLANLIEVKTGRPVTDLILEKICRPLGMNDSAFVLDAARQKRLAVGHTGNQACLWPANSPMPPWDMGDLMRPSGGMYSSLNDLLVFARANLGLLQHPLEPILAQTHQVQIETPEEAAAFGWIINRFDHRRRTLTFKHGMVAGYSGYLGLDLEARIAVVLLSNKFDWDEKVGHNLLLRLGGELKR